MPVAAMTLKTSPCMKFRWPMRRSGWRNTSTTPNGARRRTPVCYGAARVIDAQAIRYVSVRDPDHRANIALLDPAGFAAAAPTIEQTWHFRYEAGQMTAFAAFPSTERYAFKFDQFGLTPP